MNNLLTGKIFRVIELVLAETHPVSLKYLREKSGISGAVVSRIVADLIEIGMLEKSGYHEVVPSVGMLRMGMAAQSSMPLLKKLRAVLAARLPALGVSGAVYILDNGLPVEIFSSHPLRPFQAGDNFTTAAVLALLAPLPEGGGVIEIPEFPAGKYDLAGLQKTARRDGCIIRESAGSGWEIYAPFRWYGGSGVLSFYGDDLRVGQELVLTAGECRRLCERLASLLTVA